MKKHIRSPDGGLQLNHGPWLRDTLCGKTAYTIPELYMVEPHNATCKVCRKLVAKYGAGNRELSEGFVWDYGKPFYMQSDPYAKRLAEQYGAVAIMIKDVVLTPVWYLQHPDGRVLCQQETNNANDE